jgi:hypothetical protein
MLAADVPPLQAGCRTRLSNANDSWRQKILPGSSGWTIFVSNRADRIGVAPYKTLSGERLMTIKDILSDFDAGNKAEDRPRESLREETERQLEARIEKMSRCFEEKILPVVRAVEKDLQGLGLWHKIHVGQSTSRQTGEQNIGEVEFYFFPEKFGTTYHRQRLLDAAYKAFFRASGDHRSVTFSLRFPQRLPQQVAFDEESHPIDEVDKKQVEDFLERFVKGALEAYQSDRLML